LGIATINLFSGSYPYTVSKTSYIEFSESVSVESAPQIVEVVLQKEKYEKTFKVQDTENNPINEATILINETELTTNEQGIATISLISGSYPYTVSKIGYIEFSESVSVESEPQTVYVTLEKETFPITFEVTNIETSQPIADAEIYISTFENPFFTDVFGISIMYLHTGSYHYFVTKENYNDVTGTLNVDNEAKIEFVEMTEKVSIETITNYELEITNYPNPTAGELKIKNYKLKGTGEEQLRTTNYELHPEIYSGTNERI